MWAIARNRYFLKTHHVAIALFVLQIFTRHETTILYKNGIHNIKSTNSFLHHPWKMGSTPVALYVTDGKYSSFLPCCGFLWQPLIRFFSQNVYFVCVMAILYCIILILILIFVETIDLIHCIYERQVFLDVKVSNRSERIFYSFNIIKWNYTRVVWFQAKFVLVKSKLSCWAVHTEHGEASRLSIPPRVM